MVPFFKKVRLILRTFEPETNRDSLKTSLSLTKHLLPLTTSRTTFPLEARAALSTTDTQTSTTPPLASGGRLPSQLASSPLRTPNLDPTLVSSGYLASWTLRPRLVAVLVLPVTTASSPVPTTTFSQRTR